MESRPLLSAIKVLFKTPKMNRSLDPRVTLSLALKAMKAQSSTSVQRYESDESLESYRKLNLEACERKRVVWTTVLPFVCQA